jgi:hypothetical protein
MKAQQDTRRNLQSSQRRMISLNLMKKVIGKVIRTSRMRMVTIMLMVVRVIYNNEEILRKTNKGL